MNSSFYEFIQICIAIAPDPLFIISKYGAKDFNGIPLMMKLPRQRCRPTQTQGNHYCGASPPRITSKTCLYLYETYQRMCFQWIQVLTSTQLSTRLTGSRVIIKCSCSERTKSSTQNSWPQSSQRNSLCSQDVRGKSRKLIFKQRVREAKKLIYCFTGAFVNDIL